MAAELTAVDILGSDTAKALQQPRVAAVLLEPTVAEQRCVVAFGVWIGLQAAKVIHELYGGGDSKGPPYPAHPAVLVLEAAVASLARSDTRVSSLGTSLLMR